MPGRSQVASLVQACAGFTDCPSHVRMSTSRLEARCCEMVFQRLRAGTTVFVGVKVMSRFTDLH
jgi:hypothetical protein